MPDKDQRYTDEGVRLVAGCVPVDFESKRVLLVTSRKHAGRWVLPKGGWNENESEDQAAVREVWEEAGVRGDVVTHLGVWDHDKIQSNGLPKARLAFYLLRVTHMDSHWPESFARTRKYFTIDEALELAHLQSMRNAIKATFEYLQEVPK